MILIIPGIFYGNLDYRLLLSTLPAIFSFAHVFFLRRDMDRSDEERPIKRKEKREISRLGRLYADALSTNLLLLSVTVRKQRRDIYLNMTAAVLIYSSYIVQNFI